MNCKSSCPYSPTISKVVYPLSTATMQMNPTAQPSTPLNYNRSSLQYPNFNYTTALPSITPIYKNTTAQLHCRNTHHSIETAIHNCKTSTPGYNAAAEAHPPQAKTSPPHDNFHTPPPPRIHRQPTTHAPHI